MRDRIEKDLKAALKSGDRRRLSTLRLIKAAIKDREIALRTRRGGDAHLGEEDILPLLARMIRQREDSIEDYKRAGRDDLVRQESEEKEIIAAFLPRQLSEEEMAATCKEIIGDLGAAGLKDMGRVMGALKARYAGQMDFARAGRIVREVLG